MALVTITNPSIANSETSDVTKLTANDNDLVNGVTDGTKDIKVLSAITDTIAEQTGAAGVTVDGLKIKDSFPVLTPIINTFTAWNPSTTTSIVTSPSADTLTLANNTYVTVGSISSGTQTFTFVKPGYYQILLAIKSAHTGAFTVSIGRFALGGTATVYSTYASNDSLIYDDPTDTSSSCNTASLVILATANQTLTVLPASNTTVSTANQHTYSASVQIFPISG